MEPLIVCYSHSGNNRRLATRLRGRLGCDILHIDERRKRKTLSILLDFIFNRNARLSDYRFTGRKHDVLVLVAPIWGGKLAAPMREFFGKERDNIHKYLLITLCNGVEGQKEKLEAELSSIVGKEPVGTTKLWMKGINTRASPGKWRLRLLSHPKGRGMDPYVACTRSGEWTIAWSHSSRFVWQSTGCCPKTSGTR